MIDKKIRLMGSIAIACSIAVVFLLIIYQASNMRIPISAEKAKLQLFEKIRSISVGPKETVKMDSVVMIDVHYDKELVVEHDNGLPNGMIPVTNRSKLYTLLSFLNERGDYRYIVLDIFLEESDKQESDSALYRLIAQMPRIVIAKPLNGLLADSCLEAKAGVVKYGTTIWETDFVKYPFQTDGEKSLSLKMYEDLTGRTITKDGRFYYDQGLARNSVILTYEYNGEDMSWDLGLGLLGDSIDGIENTPELDYLETKNKYILIGDFEGDIHQTFLGDMSGTIINFNAYLSLLRQHHIISPWFIICMFVIFATLAWLTITENKHFMWLCSLIGIPTFLLVLCLLIYLTANEVYDVLIATSLFWILKAGVVIKSKIQKKIIKKIIMNKLGLVFLAAFMLMFFSTVLDAKRLKIVGLRNCTSIQIGRKKLKIGDYFESWQTVHWNKGRQLIKVVDDRGVYYQLTRKGFEKHNAKSPDQYFIAEEALGSKYYSHSSIHYTKRDYYLTENPQDTILFPTLGTMPNDMHAETVWTDTKGKPVVTTIQRTDDGLFYIISPKIWANRPPKDVYISIREITKDSSWVNNIYEGIHIVIP